MPTPEEREARNEQERARYAALPESEKEKLREQRREWKKERAEKNPEAHQAAVGNLVASRRERYKNDPEYREHVKKMAREGAKARRAAKKKGAGAS